MNILTIDIEDWFHLLSDHEVPDPEKWAMLPSRIHQALDVLLEILQKTNTPATFFIVGWMAEKHPDIVKKIVSLGYEIACQGHHHRLVYTMTPEEFSQDTRQAIQVLEHIGGQKITAYRAPGFSITHQTPWAFDILAENGITRDSSLFPGHRAHGGYHGLQTHSPFIIQTSHHSIREFPISTVNFLGIPLAFGGGGYFRLLPYPIIRHLSKRKPYIMSYFHPRDVDTQQGVLPGLSLSRRFRAYYGINNCGNKMERWLSDFHFTDLRTFESQVNWSEVEIRTITTPAVR
ncbi:MAG: polysaccharide deacetylase family protein [Bacteroidales bacterium]|nr:polysaccharide deacetylase family protein [Bacteroidales bacterium]